MLVELVLRGPDDGDFEVKFLKRADKLGNGFVFPGRKFVSDGRSEIVSVPSDPSSVVAYKAPFSCFEI